PWRGATSTRDDHCAWTSGEESHACGAGGSVLADRFVSSMVSGVGSSVPRVAAPPSYLTRWCYRVVKPVIASHYTSPGTRCQTARTLAHAWSIRANGGCAVTMRLW